MIVHARARPRALKASPPRRSARRATLGTAPSPSPATTRPARLHARVSRANHDLSRRHPALFSERRACEAGAARVPLVAHGGLAPSAPLAAPLSARRHRERG